MQASDIIISIRPKHVRNIMAGRRLSCVGQRAPGFEPVEPIRAGEIPHGRQCSSSPQPVSSWPECAGGEHFLLAELRRFRFRGHIRHVIGPFGHRDVGFQRRDIAVDDAELVQPRDRLGPLGCPAFVQRW